MTSCSDVAHSPSEFGRVSKDEGHYRCKHLSVSHFHIIEMHLPSLECSADTALSGKAKILPINVFLPPVPKDDDILRADPAISFFRDFSN